VTIPFLRQDSSSAGSLTVLPGTFPPGTEIKGVIYNSLNTPIGCTVYIKQSSASQSVQKADPLDCKSKKELTSAGVDLRISDNCGSMPFKKSVTIELFSKVRLNKVTASDCKTNFVSTTQVVDTDSACIAFQKDDNSDWKCLSQKDVKSNPDYLAFRSQTDHFTFEHSSIVFAMSLNFAFQVVCSVV